ncbi:MAG: ATP-binding cassette domain-containing protein [bacterium]|nr:ATP-binding cassette domain-containing protein [bacterium]
MAVESLSIHYGSVAAVRDITLQLPKGEITAIIGPSGSGKSSFLGALNRMVELAPRSRVTGRVAMDGNDIYAPGVNVTALRRRIGMIFQKPNPFPLSIRRNITLALAEQGVRRKADQERILETVLHDVGLWDETRDRLDKSALELSGGQQQRLCIARALALNPEVLLLDEPCSALDPISTEIIEELIVRLRDQLTLVIVTHNLGQACRLADTVALFWVQDGAGRLIEHGVCEQIFNQPCEDLTASYIRGRKG